MASPFRIRRLFWTVAFLSVAFLRWEWKSHQIFLLQSAKDVAIEGPRTSSKPRTVVERPVRRWAYAFLVAGCDPANEGGYLGYVYNAIVAAHILKSSGSVADVVVMVQMSHGSEATRLPDAHEELMRGVGIRVTYLPKPTMKENFYTVIMEKFRILDLIEYSRVLFLDSDVMPYCNLDYVLDMSEPLPGVKPTIKENLVLGWKTEPANAGFFVLRPEPGAFRRISRMAEDRLRRDAALPPPYFNETIGWGRVMEAPKDFARFFDGSTTDVWDWHGAYADQGMLYYWTKYVKQSLTTVCRDHVEHWSAATDEDAARDPNLTLGEVFVTEVESPFLGKSCVREKDRSRHAVPIKPFYTTVPHGDFFHFTGKKKPWENPVDRLIESGKKAKDQREYWFHTLRDLQKKFPDSHLGGVDLVHMQRHERNMVGYPKPEQIQAVAKDMLNITLEVKEDEHKKKHKHKHH